VSALPVDHGAPAPRRLSFSFIEPGQRFLQRASQLSKLRHSSLHVVEPGGHRSPHVIAGSVPIGGEIHDLANLGEPEPECLTLANEVQVFDGPLAEVPVSAVRSSRRRQQPLPLIEPNGVGRDARPPRQFSDFHLRHPCA
jgi:hypothetical protein